MPGELKFSLEELLKVDSPYLSMKDITTSDWVKLDVELEEKFDKDNMLYDPKDSLVLAFVLQQIHYDLRNFNEIPSMIRNGPKFQELAVKYNPKLSSILFPGILKVQNIGKSITFHGINCIIDNKIDDSHYRIIAMDGTEEELRKDPSFTEYHEWGAIVIEVVCPICGMQSWMDDTKIPDGEKYECQCQRCGYMKIQMK